MSSKDQPSPRVRAQRPDATAPEQNVSTKLDAQGHTTADTGPETGDTDGVIAADQDGEPSPEAGDADDYVQAEPEADGTPHFHPPFTPVGNILQDAHGRTVATVGAPHMIPATREKAARWLADKLNA